MLTLSACIGYLILGEIFIGLVITGVCLNNDDDPSPGILWLVAAILIPILLFKDITFVGALDYLPCYLAGVIPWFFIKWLFTVIKVAGEIEKINANKKPGDIINWKYHKYTYEEDNKLHLRQPRFDYLLTHALLFPFSLISTIFESVLLKLFNALQVKMQQFSDSFLPEDLNK